MTSYQKYHPYRFSRLATESAKRLQSLLNEGSYTDAQGLLERAYPMIGKDKLHRRVRDKGVISKAHNTWASNGRQVVDLSELMGYLADATAIEFNTMPEGAFPSAFYMHFGIEAGLILDGQSRNFIAGVMATSYDMEGEQGLYLNFVRGSVEPEPVETMTLPQLLEEETAVALIAAPRSDLFKIFSDVPSGDPRIGNDPVYRAATLRALVGFRHVVAPQLLEELESGATLRRLS